MSPLPIMIVEVLGMGSISIASVEALTRARHLIGIELKILIRKKIYAQPLLVDWHSYTRKSWLRKLDHLFFGCRNSPCHLHTSTSFQYKGTCYSK